MKGVLIFSGYNHRGIIAFCRYCRKNSISFFIIAAGRQDLILYSDYKKNVVKIRESNELDVENLIHYKNEIINNHAVSELLILPSTEYLNRFLLKNRKALEIEGYTIPLCSMKLYSLLSNKYSFGKLCKNHHINIPAEYKTIEAATIPFVVKPKKYLSDENIINKKPVIVTGEDEYHQRKKTTTNDLYYYQEFVRGGSYYLLYYFSKDKTYSVYSQKNLMQQYNGRSIIAAQTADIHRQEVASKYGSLLLSLNFVGLAMIELRFFKNIFYMIEINPRIWGPSQLILDAGMDLFDRFAFDNDLISELTQITDQVGKKYFWSGGIMEDQKKGKSTTFHKYDKPSFFDEYTEWCKADIYLRPDTFPIYREELMNGYGY